MPFDLDRFLALVRRELGASEARILELEDSPLEVADARELRGRTPDGRVIAVRFEVAPPDREAKQRRLEMVVSTFDAVVDDAPRSARSRPPIVGALQEELASLCTRAAAQNAVVIDAHSPVVWGAADPTGLATGEGASRAEVGGGNEVGRSAEPAGRVVSASRAAIDAVRGLSDGAASRKGKHVRHFEREGPAPFVAHSFAGIYLLVLVYDGPFDELGAERSIVDALPRVERLVLALPPLDPSPMAGARALSLAPRRR